MINGDLGTIRGLDRASTAVIRLTGIYYSNSQIYAESDCSKLKKKKKAVQSYNKF